MQRNLQIITNTVSITQSEYNLTTPLTNGMIEWNVKARDATGNSSRYVIPITFTVRSMPSNYHIYLPILLK